MRYYQIVIDGGPTYTSYNSGSFLPGSRNIPGALNIEMDIPVIAADTPAGDAYIKIWGISKAQISQAKKLAGNGIKIFGGFQKGLPLANPSQAGLLFEGWIFQSYGNWNYLDQNLVLIIRGGSAPKEMKKQVNLPFIWKKGNSLEDAIRNTLTTGYPGCDITINISKDLVYPEDQAGIYGDLTSYAQTIKQQSRAILGGNYNGVSIVQSGSKFNVFDSKTTSSSGSSKVNVSFADLIGQPTWLQAPLISFKTAMRSDIKVRDEVTLPKSVVTNSSQAQTSLVNQDVTFQGGFRINSVRHVGIFRQPDAASWVTCYEAVPLDIAGSSPG